MIKFLVALSALSAGSLLAVVSPAGALNNAPWPFGPPAYTLSQYDCDNLCGDYMGQAGEAVQDLANGDTQRASEDITAANKTLLDAKSGGCSRAFTVTPPKLPTVTPISTVTVVKP